MPGRIYECEPLCAQFDQFGAIVDGMIVTFGDVAFVMIVQFPGTGLILFGNHFYLNTRQGD